MRWPIGANDERESKEFVLSAGHYDEDLFF